MKILTYILGIFLLTGCRESNKQSNNQAEFYTDNTPDTIIGSRQITNGIAESAYRKRATGYFVITKTDTSSYMPIFTETKNGGQVALNLNIAYLDDSLTFRQRMNELGRILPKASKEYDFDSLTGITIGRLIQTGDLAIEITEQYKDKMGTPTSIRTADYENISKFLKESKLADEFNVLFQPYSLIVDKIGVEKVFFARKEELMHILTHIDHPLLSS